ncbi:nitric oxide reductase transcription regulator, partial [Klebsiella pneumoniae]
MQEGSAGTANPRGYLNGAGVREGVAERGLLGRVKGEVTGAISNHSGKVEMADNGTMSLDEIGELSLARQAQLLRVLPYGDLHRVVDERILRVDVRVRAETDGDLCREVAEGLLRAGLHHGLSLGPLEAPALCQRR